MNIVYFYVVFYVIFNELFILYIYCFVTFSYQKSIRQQQQKKNYNKKRKRKKEKKLNQINSLLQGKKNDERNNISWYIWVFDVIEVH